LTGADLTGADLTGAVLTGAAVLAGAGDVPFDVGAAVSLGLAGAVVSVVAGFLALDFFFFEADEEGEGLEEVDGEDEVDPLALDDGVESVELEVGFVTSGFVAGEDEEEVPLATGVEVPFCLGVDVPLDFGVDVPFCLGVEVPFCLGSDGVDVAVPLAFLILSSLALTFFSSVSLASVSVAVLIKSLMRGSSREDAAAVNSTSGFFFVLLNRSYASST